MSKQIAVAIMAILASVSVADAATVTTVTPPPAIAKAMASAHRQYCLMDAGSQGRMQHRLSILGIKTKIRTGVAWPLVMYYHRVCAPTKADLRIYEQAHYPMVEMVRQRFHAQVWTIHQAVNFCAKREGMKHWDGGKNTTFGQLDSIENRCFRPKK
jgi:hypothetical protein